MLHASSSTGVVGSALKLARSSMSCFFGTSSRITAAVVLTIAVAGTGAGLVWQYAVGAFDSGLKSSKKMPPLQQAAKPDVPQPRLDLLGDKLPEGAIARLGGSRFRISDPDVIAYAPDGKVLFAGSQQGITLFDATTGRALQNMGQELKTPCMTTALSPDGRLAAVGGLAGSPSAAIYETATGKRLCALQPSDKSGTRLGGFSPDGALLATTAHSCRVDLYDSRTGKQVRTLEWEFDGQARIYEGDVAFMPDGTTLLTSTRSTGVIRRFDIPSGQEIFQFTASPNGIAGMVLSPDGTRVAVLESEVGRSSSYQATRS